MADTLTVEQATRVLDNAQLLAALALHRWRHPSFELGKGTCRCKDDAELAVAMVLADMTGREAKG